MTDIEMNEDELVAHYEAEMDTFFERQAEYSKHVADKVMTAFSFKDWYAQTYNESISDDTLDMCIESIHDVVCESVGEHLMELNGR